MKDWEKFEDLISRIQSDLAPNATVEHNKKVLGRSGIKRQIDVAITTKIGVYKVLIAIECKDYKRRVGVDKVEAFITKLHDVGASEGVMISTSGFTKGAIASAKDNRIKLFTYREAQNADWKDFVKSESWIKFIISKPTEIKASARIESGDKIILTSDTKLLDEYGHLFSTIKDTVLRIGETTAAIKPVGKFSIETVIDPPLYIKHNDEIKRIERLIIKGENSARGYIINLKFASGHVLEDQMSSENIYQQLVSEGFDWNTVITSQEGQKITEREFEDMKQDGKYQSFPLNMRTIDKYLRIVATKTGDDSSA